MKDVYLVSNVRDGGKTYLGYLLPALRALRDHYNCIVLHTNITGLSKDEAEQFLSYPVEAVGVEYIAKLKSQTIISNDAFIGGFLDESNFAVFISHGNVGMPLQDKYYVANLLSYWDAIVAPSRSSFALLKKGLQLYRHERKLFLEAALELPRSDLRRTSAISTLPIKIPKFFSAPPVEQKTPGQCVVGIMPTQLVS